VLFSLLLTVSTRCLVNKDVHSTHNEVKMTWSGEGLANVKLKWLCFPSLRITEQNLLWYVEKLEWKFIPIPIALFTFPYFHSHSHSHKKGKGAYSSSWNSPQNYGTPLVNKITQCYLPPDRGDHDILSLPFPWESHRTHGIPTVPISTHISAADVPKSDTVNSNIPNIKSHSQLVWCA